MERLKSVSPIVRLGIVVAIGVVFICCCLGILIATSDPDELAGSLTPTRRPTTPAGPATEAETDAPGGFEGPTSAPTSALEFPLIPGMALIDFTFNLEDRGFTCTDTVVLNNRYSTSCTDDSTPTVLLTAMATGPDDERVDYLTATVTQTITPSDDIAAVFLGFVATMPYEGASPEAAKAWVEATLPLVGDGSTPQTTNFGSVKFTLSGDPANRTLEMEGAEPSSASGGGPLSIPIAATDEDVVTSQPTVEASTAIPATDAPPPTTAPTTIPTTVPTSAPATAVPATPADRHRTGALCVDGSTSGATGSGACSGHGGVQCWYYSDGTCTKP